jgi:hypothetical protein
MERDTRRLAAIAAAVALAAATAYWMAGCGEKTAVPEPPAAGGPAAGVAAGRPAAAGRGPAAAAGGDESHRVERCVKHYYRIAPGETASVTFETIVDADTARIALEEEPEVRKERMEDAGWRVSYTGRSVDSFSVDSHIWTVSEPDFATKGEGWLKTLPGSVANISWAPDGEGIFTRLGDLSGAYAIGRLSFEEVSGRLGGNGTVDIRGPNGKMYYLVPARKEVAREFHILSVSMDIAAPGDDGGRSGAGFGSVTWKGQGVHFNRDYRKREGRYVISGPAAGRECCE